MQEVRLELGAGDAGGRFHGRSKKKQATRDLARRRGDGAEASSTAGRSCAGGRRGSTGGGANREGGRLQGTCGGARCLASLEDERDGGDRRWFKSSRERWLEEEHQRKREKGARRRRPAGGARRRRELRATKALLLEIELARSGSRGEELREWVDRGRGDG